MSNLTSLQSLYMPNNCLSGALPGHLSKLTNLKELNLAVNDLSGCFPAAYSVFCSRQANVNMIYNFGLPGGGGLCLLSERTRQ